MPDAQPHPQPCVQREERTQASHHRYAERSGIPCAMVYGLLRDLPGVPGFVATVARNHLANLTSASGGQDHTASPSASCAPRLGAPTRPSHPASRFVTIGRNVPLLEAGRRGLCR
jgi:hypothetical protein